MKNTKTFRNLESSPRRVQLREWLDKIDARELATIPGPNGSQLRFYAVNPLTFILQIWGMQHPDGEISWELYAPVTTNPETAETFAAFERALDSARLCQQSRANLPEVTRG